MSTEHKITQALDGRRRELGMSMRLLAQRTGVGVATVQRVLSGRSGERLSTICALADALGVSLRLARTIPAARYRRMQAQKKARQLVGMVQGNAALEGQATDQRSARKVARDVERRLLAGPNIRLWS